MVDFLLADAGSVGGFFAGAPLFGSLSLTMLNSKEFSQSNGVASSEVTVYCIDESLHSD